MNSSAVIAVIERRSEHEYLYAPGAFFRQLLVGFKKFKTVHFRHTDIEQDDLGLLPPGHIAVLRDDGVLPARNPLHG